MWDIVLQQFGHKLFGVRTLKNFLSYRILKTSKTFVIIWVLNIAYFSLGIFTSDFTSSSLVDINHWPGLVAIAGVKKKKKLYEILFCNNLSRNTLSLRIQGTPVSHNLLNWSHYMWMVNVNIDSINA